MNIKNKDGMTTGIGAMLLSIIAAGVVTTSSYDYKIDAKNEIAQAIQFSKYYDAVVSRVSDDNGYAISNNTAATVPEQNEKNQVGTPWLKYGDIKAKDCIENSTCDGLFQSGDTEYGTMNSFRHLFTPIDSSCSYYSDIGSWHSLNAVSGNIMPCNIFRVRGPLNTRISDNEKDLNVVTMAVNTRNSKVDQSSEGVENTKDILDINFYIPISSYISSVSDSKRKRLLVFTDKLADLLNGKAALSIVKSAKVGDAKLNGFRPGSTELGLGPSVLLSNECEERSSIVCYLKVSFITRLHMKGGQGGCTDCLKLDSSNSMYGAITFKDKNDKGQDLVDSVLLAWKTDSTKTKKERENPTPENTVSGIITEGSGLKFKVSNNEIIQLDSDPDGKNQLILTSLELTTKIDDDTFTSFTKTINPDTSAEDVEFNIKMDNNEIFQSKKKNGEYSVGINRSLDGGDSGGIEVSNGVIDPILRVGQNKLVGVTMSAGNAGYYEVGEVPAGGQIVISGTIKRGAEQMKIDLSFSSGQVTGTVNGTVPTGSSIYMNSSGKVYLRRTTDTYFNLDISANGSSILTFDKSVDVTGSLSDVTYDLAIRDNEQGGIRSNILRTSIKGVIESDADHFKISKALDQFALMGDPTNLQSKKCLYKLDTSECTVTEEELKEFYEEVPNVDKTIELIKEYTPNQHIAYQTQWLPIQSISDINPGLSTHDSYFGITHQKSTQDILAESPRETPMCASPKRNNADGKEYCPTRYKDLPDRVRVIVRAKDGAYGCSIPADMRDYEGYFYQEALPAAPTDDDINDTGSGVVYSYNKDGVQIYAPTMKGDASSHRYLFYTYDGWGNERGKFHCDVGEVKLIVYRPSNAKETHEVAMFQPAALEMKKEVKVQRDYKQQSSGIIYTTPTLSPGIYFLNTEWNTDYYRFPEQYPEDITLFVRQAGAPQNDKGEGLYSNMTVSDGIHWVLGEQPLRRASNTTFDMIQIKGPTKIELYMQVDDFGYRSPDGTYNGHIDINIVSVNG